MSSIVKFFVATRADAFDMLQTGPDVSFRVASFGNFDAEEALLDWESRLTGRSFETLVHEDIPEMLVEDESGMAVFAMSDTLVNSFASASGSQIEDLAEWWVNEKSGSGMEIALPVALDILRQLVDLVLVQRKSGERIYCWTG
jgi:hypothetical protein